MSGTTLYLGIPATAKYAPAANITIADTDFTPANIKTGINIFGVTGTFTSDANASAGNILSGKTAYVNGAKITGTMGNRETGDYGADGSAVSGNTLWLSVPGSAFYGTGARIGISDGDFASANIRGDKNIFGLQGSMTIRDSGDYAADASSVSGTTLKLSVPDSAFYGDSANITITDAQFTAANIKTGQNLFGITGTFTSDANATAAQILTGRTAYVNGSKITGTMPDRAGDTAAVASAVSGTTLRLRASAGYRDGTNDYVTLSDGDWIAANIVSGKNIFGVTGNALKVESASGTTTNGSNNRVVVTGLGFSKTPRIVMIWEVSTPYVRSDYNSAISTTNFFYSTSNSVNMLSIADSGSSISSSGFNFTTGAASLNQPFGWQAITW